MNNLANIDSDRGDHAAAVKLYEREIAIAKSRGEIGDVALGQQNMAIDLYAEGDRERGAAAFNSALEWLAGLATGAWRPKY